LPLWSPVYVQLGDVGYLSKPGGTFITLFNAFKPHKTSGGLTGGLPSLAGYGKVSKGVHRQDKRNVAQKGLDAVSGFLTFTSRRSDVPISFVISSRVLFTKFAELIFLSLGGANPFHFVLAINALTCIRKVRNISI
jgi:hypothetical protein